MTLRRTRTIGKRIAPVWSMALAAALVLTPNKAKADPPTQWTDYTALAGRELVIGSNIDVFGDFGVIQPGGRLELEFNTFQFTADPPPDDALLAGDKIVLQQKASANDVFTNQIQIQAGATVRGTISQPWPFPLPVTLPSFPAGVSDPCADSAQSIVVNGNTTQQLLPGCFKNLIINGGGTLELVGSGTYIFRRADLAPNAGIIATVTGVDLIFQERINTDTMSEIGPLSMNPNDLAIWMGGAQNQFGLFTYVIGTVFAPNDTNFEILKGTNFVGTIYADKLFIRGVHAQNNRTPTPTPPPTPTPTHTPTPTSPPSTPTPTPPGTPTPTPPPGTPTPTPPPGTPTPTPPPGTPTPTPPPGTPTPTPPPGTPTPTSPFVPPTPTPTKTAAPTPTPTFVPGTPTPTSPIVVPTPTPTSPFVPPGRRLKGKPWGRQFFVGNPATNYTNLFMQKPLAGKIGSSR